MSVVCGDCGRVPLETVSGASKRGDTFIEMVPGKDGKPWHLCFRCWDDGRQMKLRVTKPKMIGPEMAKALLATGWVASDNGDGTRTISPPIDR